MKRYAVRITVLTCLAGVTVPVPAHSGIKAIVGADLTSTGFKFSLADLRGAAVCLAPGRERNDLVAEFARNNGLQFSYKLIRKEMIAQRFSDGVCDAVFLDDAEIAEFLKDLEAVSSGGRKAEVIPEDVQ